MNLGLDLKKTDARFEKNTSGAFKPCRLHAGSSPEGGGSRRRQRLRKLAGNRLLEREGELLSLSSENQKKIKKRNWKTVFKSLFIGWTKRHRFGQQGSAFGPEFGPGVRARTRLTRFDLLHADRWRGTLTIVDSACFDLNRLMHILWLWSDLTFSTAIIHIFIRIDLVKILRTFCKFLFLSLLLLFNIYKYFIYKYILILL